MINNIRTCIHWKVFFALLGSSIVGTLAVLPYVFMPEVVKKLPVSLWIVVSAQVVQSALLCAFCIFIGLLLGRKIGMGAPLLEDYFGGVPIAADRVRRLLEIGAATGAIVGVTLVLIDVLFFARVALALTATFKPAWWKGFLASFYGGICEEILLRLFLMTTLSWLFLKIRASAGSIWTANVVTSIVFGLGHLPLTASLIALTPAVVARALILNGIAGVAFGWLYWKKGLETAMVAHFTTDIVLHVIVVFFL